MGVSRGWRRVLGIADQGVVWVTRAWSGWRRVFGIADQGVVWVAPCLRDCWWACRVGGAVS